MKIFLLSLAALVLLTGCTKKIPPQAPAPSEAPSSSSREEVKPESSEEEKLPQESTPEKVAEELLDNISNIDDEKIGELAGQFFPTSTIPEEFYGIIKPISERVTYKIGSSRIDGDKAAVDVTVTTVDVQKAINSAMPGAVAHLAAMQITGKDISNPQKILAEYAANNIKWDELPTIKTDTTLYLTKRADGEWDVDATNPDNMGFANAISGGAVEVAESLKAFADRYK